MLKQKLQQKLLQKLSPQQIQTIKLLEIPAMELEQRIKKELEENPLLEEGEEEEDIDEKQIESQDDETDSESEKNDDEFSLEDYINEDEYIPSYKLNASNSSPDDKKEDIPFSEGSTFQELLESQLGLRELNETQEMLSGYIIGNIDEDGYLRRELSSIVDDIAFQQNIATTEKELLEVLRIIQDLEPAGVGARTLQECLLLQLKTKDESLKEIKLAEKILIEHFEEFSKKHYDKIVTVMEISEKDLKQAIDEILKLNPKPGISFNDSENKMPNTIIPDFMLEFKDGDFQLNLNSKNIPELRISRNYSDMLVSYATSKENSSKEQKEIVSFVKQKLDSAKWFIDAIRQRQNTLMHTMQAILNYQQEFFVEGDEAKLKPMILKDIADKTGLDISTISRVANSKYIQTHFGIYPLKYFFTEGMQTDSGEEVSTREIKKILQECIESENKKKPLPDDKLADILNEKGYLIARRTIAKYREQLNIPVARMRKELK
jgi:RNA polymerase sigma-54 factor